LFGITVLLHARCMLCACCLLRCGYYSQSGFVLLLSSLRRQHWLVNRLWKPASIIFKDSF